MAGRQGPLRSLSCFFSKSSWSPTPQWWGVHKAKEFRQPTKRLVLGHGCHWCTSKVPQPNGSKIHHHLQNETCACIGKTSHQPLGNLVVGESPNTDEQVHSRWGMLKLQDPTWWHLAVQRQSGPGRWHGRSPASPRSQLQLAWFPLGSNCLGTCSAWGSSQRSVQVVHIEDKWVQL